MRTNPQPGLGGQALRGFFSAPPPAGEGNAAGKLRLCQPKQTEGQFPMEWIGIMASGGTRQHSS